MKIKIGTKLVEQGKVFRVIKIEEYEWNGEETRMIHYKPHYERYNGEAIICTIPECTLGECNIRAPHPKDEIKNVMDRLTKRVPKYTEIDIVEAKSTIKENDIYETVEVAKHLWNEKSKKGEEFKKQRRDVLETAISRIVEEIALVKGVSPNTAEKHIHSALDK